MSTNYIDDKGSLVFLSQGFGATSASPWFTVRAKPGRSATHRVSSPNLPTRSTRARAQADLDAYAKKRGWQEFTVGPSPRIESAEE